MNLFVLIGDAFFDSRNLKKLVANRYPKYVGLKWKGHVLRIPLALDNFPETKAQAPSRQ